MLRLDTVRQAQSLIASARAEFSRPQAATSSVPTPPWIRRFALPMPADTAQGQARAISNLLGLLADASVAVIPQLGLVPRVGASGP